MSNSLNILLFDVDGVIVDPLAYKIGIRKTLELLCDIAGVISSDAILPNHEDISFFESCGIHDVWDITSIMFAAILTAIAAELKDGAATIFQLGETATEQLASLKPLRLEIAKPDYRALAEEISSTSPSAHPPDVALSLLSGRLTALTAAVANAWIALLRRFLVGTRSVYESYGTRLFQNIILGGEEFQSTYELAGEYGGESLLRTVDRSQVSRESVDKLNAFGSEENCMVAIYTARPSHPPADATGSRVGYSPEAELALQTAHIEGFPLVGMGMMEWLAQEKNVPSESLTKPNTTHAIAALMSCVAQATTSKILEEAYRFDKSLDPPDTTVLRQLKGKNVVIYVFEDTTSGITPMLHAAAKLNGFGYSIAVIPLGIAKDKNKILALKAVCEKVFSDVNDAIDFALNNRSK